MYFGCKHFGLLARSVRWKCTFRKTCKCKLLVVGGGTGGCNIVWRFSRKMNPKDITLLEPSDIHYYQPTFVFVASGIRRMRDSYNPLHSMLPRGITWHQDSVQNFDPCCNAVYTRNGTKIIYEYMVVSIGVKNDYDKIIGLKNALNDAQSGVSTIYSPDYCMKTWKDIRKFKGGHAVFTYPTIGGKCPGAIFMIMFLADAFWRKHKIRYKTSISFNSANSTIFGIPKYATTLTKLTSQREIVTNLSTDLVEVTPTVAIFRKKGGELVNFPYNMLQVSPPMSPPACLTSCAELVNEQGYLDVDKHTLQHKSFPNVFGLGDCTSTPNSKTAAATGPQSYALELNLTNIMAGRKPTAKYDGYGACPLLTSYNSGLLAEFLYDKKVCETFPINQAKECYLFYLMNVSLFPFLYWRYLVRGNYNGPGGLRNILNPNSCKN